MVVTKLHGGVWTLLSLSAFILASRSLAAPTSQRDQNAAAAAQNDAPPLIRVKRADEIIFNSQTGVASRAKKSNDATSKESDDKGSPGGPVTVARDAGDTAAAADNVQDAADNSKHDETHADKKSQQQGDSRSVATSSGGDKASSLMLAENMDIVGQPEQKLRAKRDLDADQIRELFASQRQSEPADDYFAPDYSYEDVDAYDDPERGALYDDIGDDTDAWQYPEDYYDQVSEGRPKRTDDELYQNDAEREAVRELLAERAAEEARQALLAYLTAGEPTYRIDEPQYLIDPTAEELALEDEDYSELMNGDEARYDEEPELTEEKRYPYSYEPYGGRWGALVPGAKRGDRDPYDRLYRLAEVLSRPAQLGGDVDEYEKKK